MEETGDNKVVKGPKKDLSALEMVPIPIFVANQERVVIYCNEAFAELAGEEKERLEGSPVNALIKSETSGIEKTLATGDTAPIESWATINDKNYFFEYRPIPSYDSRGNIVGVVATIMDRTSQKLALQVVQDLVGRTKDGDLAARATITAEGDYQLLIDGINEILDALIEPLKVAADYIDRISRGDIPEKICGEYKGDFNGIKNNLNSCIDEIGILSDEIGVVIGLSREGNLARRANPDRSKGVYQKILQGINDALDALINPLNVAADYVYKISRGGIPERITEEYSGDFNNIKNNLNTCIEAIKGVIGEIGTLANAVSFGDLAQRGNVDEFHGVYKEMIQGMNELIDAIACPLDELMTCLGKMSLNDLTVKMERDYTGIWEDLKTAVNSVNERLISICTLVTAVSNGDTSLLDEYKRIGRRSENDTLVPAFIKLFESTNQMAETAQCIADGDLSAMVITRSDKDILAKSLSNMLDVLCDLENEMKLLTEAARDGDLQVRGDVAKFQGGYSEIVAGVNSTLDAVLSPIKEASDVLKEMARGNLDIEMKGDYKGDHAVIKENLNATLAALNDILNQVAVAVDQVTTGARQVSDSSQSLSQAATESASSLEEITASMHELTSQTNLNAENATQANQLSMQARISAEKGDREMGNMLKAMSDINESAANISKIIKAIDEIAFQTNLLALNAAVEAARAGKHGKGFTVVAEEVRNLAQRSAAAAKETAKMIEGSIKKTEVGTRIAEETSKALEEIVTGSTKVTDLIGEIASASKEQAQGINQINQGLSQVDQVTQQVTASAEESASASEELSSQSLQLKQMLTKFQLRMQGSVMPAGRPAGITPEIIQMLKMMIQSG